MGILRKIWDELINIDNCVICGEHTKIYIFGECKRCWFAPDSFSDFKRAQQAGKISQADLVAIREHAYAEKERQKQEELDVLQKRASEILRKEKENAKL